MKLDCLRDLMRMEMPDRWTDVVDAPVYAVRMTPYKMARPALQPRIPAAVQQQERRPSTANQAAECLYLIVMKAQQEDGDGRDAIKADNIEDTDGDGYMEFVDGWGTPIRFIRWPAGFPSPT